MTQRQQAAARLGLAARRGDWAAVCGLLAGGAAADVRSAHGAPTVLMRAARAGSVEACEALLAARADVNARDGSRSSALFYACAGSSAAVVHVLLRHGAELHACDGRGRSPLLVAAAEGGIEAARALLEANADVHHAVPRSDEVHRSGLTHRVQAACLEGRSTNAPRCAGNALDRYVALTRASEWQEIRRLSDEQEEVSRMADESGHSADSDVPAGDENVGEVAEAEDLGGAGPQCGIARAWGLIDEVPLDEGGSYAESDLSGNLEFDFLSKVAPLRRVDLAKAPPSADVVRAMALKAQDLRGLSAGGWQGRGETALAAAARRGDPDMCRLLIEHRADAEARDADRDTPLCVAARAGHVEVCAALLANGASPQDIVAAGQLARLHGHDAAVTVLSGHHLLERGAGALLA